MFDEIVNFCTSNEKTTTTFLFISLYIHFDSIVHYSPQLVQSHFIIICVFKEMKNKGLYFLRKSFVKKKRFEKIRTQFYTDDKFLRKYKRSKEKGYIDTGEYNVTTTDPIENFFYAPKSVKEENEKAEEIKCESEEELEEKSERKKKRKEKDKTTIEKKEHTHGFVKENERTTDIKKLSIASSSNSNKCLSVNQDKEEKEETEKDNTSVRDNNNISKEESVRKEENGLNIFDAYVRPLKKKSPYSKQLSYAMAKKEELEKARQEKREMFSKWDAERKEKRILKYKKYKKLSRKTKKGQPIMDNIVRHLLEKI